VDSCCGAIGGGGAIGIVPDVAIGDGMLVTIGGGRETVLSDEKGSGGGRTTSRF
jgi:hypothetical protein